MGSWHMNREYARFRALKQDFSYNGHLISPNRLLIRSSELFPEKIAVQLPSGDHITFRNLADGAKKISAILISMGVQPGDRVVVLAENSIFFYFAYYGIWQTGATVVPLSTFLHEQEISDILADALPRVVVVSNELTAKVDMTRVACRVLREDEIMRSTGDSAAFKIHDFAPDAVAAILYTSGTTGKPKGVMLSACGIMTNVLQGMCRFNFLEDERVLCPLPLFHSFTQITCVWAAIATGSCVILLPKIMKDSLLQSFTYRPTFVLGIPHFFALLCRFASLSLHTVRYCISGGDAVSDAIRKIFALRFSKKICNGYGLTESGPLIAVDLDDTISTTNTIGKPVVQVMCDIRNGDHGIGILWVRGENLMLGYYHAQAATEAVLKDGWLNTGDLARFDADGKLVICGREKDLIVYRGLKIYPQEVENVLTSAPNVQLAAVIGIPDVEGCYPAAFVQTVDHKQIDPEVLIEFCKRHLAHYKVPRTVYFMKSMPMTPTGKIDKKVLMQQLHAKPSCGM